MPSANWWALLTRMVSPMERKDSEVSAASADEEPAHHRGVGAVHAVRAGIGAGVRRSRHVRSGDHRKAGGQARWGNLVFHEQQDLAEGLGRVELLVPPVRALRIADDPCVEGAEDVIPQGGVALQGTPHVFLGHRLHALQMVARRPVSGQSAGVIDVRPGAVRLQGRLVALDNGGAGESGGDALDDALLHQIHVRALRREHARGKADQDGGERQSRKQAEEWICGTHRGTTAESARRERWIMVGGMWVSVVKLHAGAAAGDGNRSKIGWKRQLTIPRRGDFPKLRHSQSTSTCESQIAG